MAKGENIKSTVKRENYESSPPIKGINYLLVIGIDNYTHCPKLYNAVKDAKDIVEILQTRFCFEKENTRTFYDEAATKRNIYKAFRFFKNKIKPTDNFIVYFSGHGEFDKDFGLGYWIPIEAEKGAVDDYMPNSEIRNIFGAIQSHHTFLMVDSCFSGALFAKSASRNISLRKERDPSRWGLTAGRNEIVTDGQPGANSPFAESILYQLRNANEPLGVAELCDNVLEVVSANADQTPRGEPLKVGGHKGGQFVFHLKMNEAGDWKNATAANTVMAYQAFITKYPDNANAAQAKANIKTLQAQTLWQQIELAKDTHLHEIKSKLSLINQYVDNYENQLHYDAVLNLGELLEYKKQFLNAKSSEFALRRFLRKNAPDVPGATAITESAQQSLNEFNKEEKETLKDTPKERKKLKIAQPIKKQKEEKAKPVEIRKKSVKKWQSFLKKNAKYILLLLLLPFFVWGIIKMIDRKGSDVTHLNDPKVILEDKEKPNEVRDIKKPSPEDSQKIAMANAQQSYNSFITKGKTEMNSNKPNYQIAKGHYEDALNVAKGFSIDISIAKNGITKCNVAINKQNAIEKENQRQEKLALAQKEYDQLLKEGDALYARKNYKKALSKYQAALGKVKNNDTARIRLANCQNKLDEIEKLAQKQQEEMANRKADEKAWITAKGKNTIEAYETYQQKYPYGKYYKDATSQIKALKNAINLNARSGFFVDSRDGLSYKWIRLKDGKKWMTENLNYKISNSWCYEDKNNNCSKFGRIYTWKSALVACPKGWRLPSDKEWWIMLSYYGKASNGLNGQQENKSSTAGKAAYKALLDGSQNGFSARLGGNRISQGYFHYGGDRGFYWSQSKEGSSNAINYEFNGWQKYVIRSSSSRKMGFSCRCIMD